MDANSPTAPRKTRAQDRRAKALSRRIGGWTFDRIGDELGISAQAAHKLVKSALADLNVKVAENAEELRRLEMERLDTMRNAIWGQVLAGDVQAIDRAIKIGARLAALAGLDAPAKADITSGGEAIQVTFDYAKLIGSPQARPVPDRSAPGEDESHLHGAALGQDHDGGDTGAGGG
jgi:hypothetical protein